ncbi:hypothetical protein IJ579_00605 [bacterium]|nr:hypothetical protein [bacterium]
MCPVSDDYWVGALVTCKEMGGHLPSMNELTNIAKLAFPSVANSLTDYETSITGTVTIDKVNKDVFDALGIGIDSSSPIEVCLSSSELYSDNYPYARTFNLNNRAYDNTSHASKYLPRNHNYRKFVCLADN